MLLAFDLDGVLLSTEEANRVAYRQAGVVPPADFNRRPYQEWTDHATHERKNEAFARLAPYYVKRLPLWDLFVGHRGENVVLTNSSKAKFVTLDSMFHISINARAVHVEKKIQQKIELLLRYQPAIYFDDSSENCARVRKEVGCQVCHVL